MKKYNLSKIMKAAWNLFRKLGKAAVTFGACLKCAWADAKTAAAKKIFNGYAEMSFVYNEYTFKLWQNYGRRRIYVEAGRKEKAWIDLNDNNSIHIQRTSMSKGNGVDGAIAQFLAAYEI